MTEFTDFPSALVIARTILAFILFCFLPGYFFLLAHSRSRATHRFSTPQSTAVTLLLSVVLSLISLGGIVSLLMFSIGFSLASLFIAEFILVFAAFIWWKKRISGTSA